MKTKQLFFLLLVLIPFVGFAQNNSLQLKLISTEDVDMSKVRFGKNGVNYKVGIFYQQQISKRIHWIMGAQGNRINNHPLNDCITSSNLINEKGINLNPSLGLKYYVVEKSIFDLFAGLNAIGQYANTNGKIYYFPENNYGTFNAQTVSLGLEPNIGAEVNIHPKLFLQTNFSLRFGKSQIRRTVTPEQGVSPYSTKMNDVWEPTSSISLRLGYRF